VSLAGLGILEVSRQSALVLFEQISNYRGSLIKPDRTSLLLHWVRMPEKLRSIWTGSRVKTTLFDAQQRAARSTTSLASGKRMKCKPVHWLLARAGHKLHLDRCGSAV
jgi:hypothetical protein